MPRTNILLKGDFDKKILRSRKPFSSIIVWEPTTIVMTSTSLSFSDVGVDEVEDEILLHEVKNVFIQGQVGGAHEAMHPDDERTLVIRTDPHGNNCGRTYIFRCKTPEECNQWRTAVKAAYKAAQAREEREKILSNMTAGQKALWYARTRVRCFYDSFKGQIIVAILIFTSFASDITEAQILPDSGSFQDQVFRKLEMFYTMSVLALGLSIGVPQVKMFRLVKIFRVIRLIRSDGAGGTCGADLLQDIPIGEQNHFCRRRRRRRGVAGEAKMEIGGRGEEAAGLDGSCRERNWIRTGRRRGRRGGDLIRVQALGAAVIPVSNAFLILLLVSCIYATLATHLFRDRSDLFFGNFSKSIFSVKPCDLLGPAADRGDFSHLNSWASAITRSLWVDQPDTTMVLMNVVLTGRTIACFLSNSLTSLSSVLLDEFLSSVTREKQEEQMRKEMEAEACRISGVLDPLTVSMTMFNDSLDLNSSSSSSSRTGSVEKGAAAWEGKDSRLLPTDHPIYLIKDDFDLMTMGGQLLNEQGEFDDKQFEEMMIKELLRYSQRQLTFCMTETGDADNKAIILMLKLLEVCMAGMEDRTKAMDERMERMEVLLKRNHSAGSAIFSSSSFPPPPPPSDISFVVDKVEKSIASIEGTLAAFMSMTPQQFFNAPFTPLPPPPAPPAAPAPAPAPASSARAEGKDEAILLQLQELQHMILNLSRYQNGSNGIKSAENYLSEQKAAGLQLNSIPRSSPSPLVSHHKPFELHRSVSDQYKSSQQRLDASSLTSLDAAKRREGSEEESVPAARRRRRAPSELPSHLVFHEQSDIR
ncbi:hypothetical protein GUITHDRAFT_145749 [Guillardia theta CCMP2712]|uniref:PH domain-containing protein n=1 Tax=Guillardia theta (strain CCMP2712) TaxID=905079 RepID=L1IKN1_GUITC|nr:hypothetical protein GUITHDRAFT_145749 [Guillardia theta CCMP2712]EKX36484.1 hypothetical protein GUITHDRAFT_145749 [Guillardia theta CCMP2712]|eukprot:XP_005823464.1 hypothetical protein GUITHDRAFT_145749 [Guillardia theta CCMP2712]